MSEAEAATTRVVAHATCTFCGCVCDDIILTVENKRITEAQNACGLGEAWFAEQAIAERPFALIDGCEASTEQGVEAAAQILAAAKFPLIYGLSATTCEAQREAVAIADAIGATIDTTTSVCRGPAGIAFQHGGASTATLGEVKNRADLVIYWGANPAGSHPRHLTRYSVMPKGMAIPNGRSDRTVVLVDVQRTASAEAADIFIQVKPESDFELLWALRALVKGRTVPDTIEETTGVSLAVMHDLVERMKGCTFGVLFFGRGLTMSRGEHFNAGAILALTSDLNAFTHMVAQQVQSYGNLAGADNVLSWQTGYPYAVNFSRGYPRFNPGEFSAVDMLMRGEADAALIVASDPAANVPQDAAERLGQIPLVVLSPKPTATAALARVAFTTASYGINVPGTVYRMDNVAIELRPAFASPYPADEAVLRAIRDRVRVLVGASLFCA